MTDVEAYFNAVRDSWSRAFGYLGVVKVINPADRDRLMIHPDELDRLFAKAAADLVGHRLEKRLMALLDAIHEDYRHYYDFFHLEETAFSRQVRRLAKNIHELRKYRSVSMTTESPAVANGPAAILWHREQSYSVPGHAPIAVTEQEDAVLAEFLKTPAISGEVLIANSGVARATEVLRRLVDKYDRMFAPFIFLPGKKGKGGYTVVIRVAPE